MMKKLIKNSMKVLRLNHFSVIPCQINISLFMFLLKLKLILTATPLTQDQIREKLVKAEIIPDVILSPPLHALEVTYTNWCILKKFVEFGTVIAAKKLQSPPQSIHWPYEDGVYYTLLLTSPDAPSRVNPSLREWQHWLVGNILKNDIKTGDTLTEYRAPGFVYKTGLHRMVFLLFKQPKRISFSERKRRKRVLRSYFSTQVFSAKYNLSTPVAVNYLQIDSGTPDEYATDD